MEPFVWWKRRRNAHLAARLSLFGSGFSQHLSYGAQVLFAFLGDMCPICGNLAVFGGSIAGIGRLRVLKWRRIQLDSQTGPEQSAKDRL